MDRELPAEVIRRSKVKKIAITAAVAASLLVCYLALQVLITPTLRRSKIRTSIAERGMIEATVSASGVVVPEFEEIITSPINSTIQEVLLRSGDSVKANESILHLNREQLQLSYEKLVDELEVQKNSKKQLSLETEKKEIDLRSSHEIKTLQTQFVQSQYDRVKRLNEIGGATSEELERAALNLEIARRELDQLTRQIDNQETSLQVALEGLDLQINIQNNRINEVRRQIALAEGRAGRDGIVTFVNENIGSPVNAGDIIARVADLSSFKIEASISDIHADKLRPGGLVKVRIGSIDLPGRISSIRPAAQNGIMTFIVALDDNSNKVLRPNIRTDVFVVTSYRDNVMRVENGPFYDGLVDQEVFIIKGDGAIRKIVDIGVANFDYVELRGDIAEGDEVIISEMKKYRHMDEVAIENK